MGQRRDRAVWLGAAMCLAYAPAGDADAGFRVGRDFFDRIPHTLIDFETRGDGAPVDLDEGDAGVIPLNEYPGILFIRSRGFWTNESNDDAEAAIAIAGSLQHTLHVFPTSNDPPRVVFGTTVAPVHSVGLTVLYNRVAGPEPPVITVFGPELLVLDVIPFDEIMEGSIGVVDYGFLGFTSEERIVGLEFSTTAFVAFDDLRRSSIPAPSSLIALLLAGGAVARRKR